MAGVSGVLAVQQGLQDYRQRQLRSWERALARLARQAEAELKTSALWQDDTGAARASLTALWDKAGQSYRLWLTGYVYYLLYLELSNGKKFAILWPTMQRLSGLFVQELRNAS